ncbi:MAG: hypothetical protein K9M75_02225, partial [Phycisphaerae bacterium]|nr:hypothetical protein [Phycisphaerae bacterium]
ITKPTAFTKSEHFDEHKKEMKKFGGDLVSPRQLIYAYDSQGNRLGSYTVTPEIIDRQKAHKKQVADRWRNWWQENKQTVLAGQLPVEQPKEIAPKEKAKKTPQIKGILAPPDGAELSFAIVPEIGTDISQSQYLEYVDQLKSDGPFRGSIRGDSFQWSQIKEDCPGIDSLAVQTYEDNKYVLLCARKEYVFRPEFEGKRVWGLNNAYAGKDTNGNPLIHIEFDETGAKLFKIFTKANLGKRLAIEASYSGMGIIAAPVLQGTIEKSAIITGNFTEQQAKGLAELLKKGMPPIVPGPSDPVAKIPPKRTQAYISISYITVWQTCHQIEKLLAMNHLEYSLKLAKSLEWQLNKIKQKYDDPQYQIIVNESVQKLKLFSSALESKDSVVAKKTFEFFYQSVNETLETSYEAMGRSSKLAKAKSPKIHQYHGNIAVLDDDIVLELVGTRNHSGDNNQFVSPEGEPLVNAPYKTTALDIPQKKGFTHYELTARVTGKPDISVTWAGIAGIYDSYTATPIGHDGKMTADLNVCTTTVVDGVSGATVRVGVSAKPWEVLVAHPAGKGDHKYSTRLGSAIFGKAYEKAGKAIVSFFYDLASKQNLLPWRIVAVTDDDKEIPGKTADNQLKTSDSAEYNFDVPISSIKEFRFQARAFQCVEFDSISLKPGKGSVPLVRIYPLGYYGTFSEPDRPEGQIETVESNLGTSFPGLVKNFKSSYFSSGTGDFCRKVRFDISEKDLITALDNAANISFKYSDLKQDSTLVEHVCSVGPVNDKRKFWQEQKQKNILCAQEKKPSAGGGRSIYVGVNKPDDVNVRVYFMYAGWVGN